VRVRPLALVLLLAPVASAEFGAEDENGWPVGADGFRHDPTTTVLPEALAALWARAYTDTLTAVPTGDPLNRVAGATLYPYYPIVLAEVQRLAADHPDRVKLHIAGQSELGLDLFMLEIADWDRLEGVPPTAAAARDGTATAPSAGPVATGAAALVRPAPPRPHVAPTAASPTTDEPIPLAERPVMWIDGGTHSNEYSGVYFVLAVAQYLIEEYGRDEWATQMVQTRHTWILPIVNVDGSHLMGRLNANLVNINRNYPVVWDGEGHDALLNNRGPSPASEMETQINIDWYERVTPDYYASVHCCGNLWLYPYGEEGVDPPDQALLSRICNEAFAAVRDDCGPIWSTIYPASGSSVDTAYEVTGAAAWGFEMSGRSNLIGPWGEPVTFEEVFDQERESWAGIAHAFENVERYGAWLHLVDARVDDDTLTLTAHNAGMANATKGNVTIETARGTARVPMPFVAADGVAEWTLPWPGGDGVVRVDYAKREMASPQASATYTVLADEVDRDAPGAGALGLVALLAVAAVVLRRRS
jgi:hypothetical protein